MSERKSGLEHKRTSRSKRPPRGREFGTRFFFAAFLPENLQKKLGNVHAHLKGQWKTVPSDQLHITLLFLGNISQRTLAELDNIARSTAQSVSPFMAHMHGTGFFPNEGSPRVWFAKAKGEGFFELARLLRERIALELTNEDELDFKPHITLARKKGPAARPAPIVFNEDWNVTEFSLVRSELSRAGPSYTVLGRYPLSNPPPEQSTDQPTDSDQTNRQPSATSSETTQTISSETTTLAIPGTTEAI